MNIRTQYRSRCVTCPLNSPKSPPALLRICLAALLLLVGCGPRPPVVQGVVKLDGQPLEGVRVSLIPAGGAGFIFAAQSETGGAFQVRAQSGSYKITLVKPEFGPNPAGNLLPQVYAHPASTPFSCKVPRSDKLNLEMHSK